MPNELVITLDVKVEEYPGSPGVYQVILEDHTVAEIAEVRCIDTQERVGFCCNSQVYSKLEVAVNAFLKIVKTQAVEYLTR